MPEPFINYAPQESARCLGTGFLEYQEVCATCGGTGWAYALKP